MANVEVDFLVIGSGLAGLTFALRVAPYGSVALLTKKTRTDANSSWAQGGIAGVLADDDSFELHKQDTLVAGAGLCNEEAVAVLVHEGPERIHDLIALGASFNKEVDAQGQNVLSLGREGGHSRNRIVHTADYTGWECERTLLDAVKARPEITVFEHLFVTDLAVDHLTLSATPDLSSDPSPGLSPSPPSPERRGELAFLPLSVSESGYRLAGVGGEAGARLVCLGANALNVETGEMQGFRSRATLLATGGCGQIYQHTTNPLVATGDGVAMAWRAGSAVANMEFIQFHPTTLFHPDARAFLITEALRGEGGILRHEDGERFMQNYHPLGELAPRDIVARAIVSEMKRRNVSHVSLDVTHLDPTFLREHFPTVYERCLSVGIDITRMPIPIVPAQHYQCGGVVTDLDGATDIDRLYAAGEVASTGVHGANRLASNSLLEAMVFGQRAADHALAHCTMPSPPSRTAEPYESADSGVPRTPAEVDALRVEARELMSRYVGIVRTTAELETVRARMSAILEALNRTQSCGVEVWEARNAAQVGLLIIESALRRHESRGLHYVLDYPSAVESERHDTVLRAPSGGSDGDFK